MTRRLLVVAAAVTALFAGPMTLVAAHAETAVPYVTTNDNPDWNHWVCVAVAATQSAYCVDDPLPEHLPLPTPPAL